MMVSLAQESKNETALMRRERQEIRRGKEGEERRTGRNDKT